MTEPDLEISLRAYPENVGVVRHVLGGVAETLALDRETLDDVRLAVSEACANAVIHAYAGRACGLMDIDVHLRSRELQISVRDHGTGIVPRAGSPGLGVGLPLMASLTASMELLSPPGGGTEVRMHFPLPAPDRSSRDLAGDPIGVPARPGAAPRRGEYQR